MTDPVIVEQLNGGIVVATLNSPGTRNALSADMSRRLSRILADADSDDSVRAVIITGSPPAFCAGADLSRGSSVFAAPTSDDFSACPLDPTPSSIRKPVIAAVNGHAIGIGLTIALHCDLRVMARDAKYGIVQVRRGAMPDAFSHWTLPRLVGLAAAADLLLTGRTFDGHEAERLGVASRVVPADEVLAVAIEIATDIVTHTSPLSVALTKRLLWRSFESDLSEVGAAETLGHRALFSHADAREGVSAFLEGRAPTWRTSVPRDWPADRPEF